MHFFLRLENNLPPTFASVCLCIQLTFYDLCIYMAGFDDRDTDLFLCDTNTCKFDGECLRIGETVTCICNFKVRHCSMFYSQKNVLRKSCIFFCSYAEVVIKWHIIIATSFGCRIIFMVGMPVCCFSNEGVVL